MLTVAQLNAGAQSSRSGRDHLENRSRLKMQLSQSTPINNILIIDDTASDSDVLASMLRLVFDADVGIRTVRFARDIRKAIVDSVPQLIFLDDRLGHGTSAEVSLNVIRTSGFTAGVIVMSGLLSRARQIELMRLGVADVVHKDDINVARLTEAVLKVLSASETDKSSPSL